MNVPVLLFATAVLCVFAVPASAETPDELHDRMMRSAQMDCENFARVALGASVPPQVGSRQRSQIGTGFFMDCMSQAAEAADVLADGLETGSYPQAAINACEAHVSGAGAFSASTPARVQACVMETLRR